MIHHTLAADVDVLSWEIVDDEWECCAPALIDRAHVLSSGDPYFARINYGECLAFAELVGGQMASFEQLMWLHNQAPFQLQPYLGTPRAENEIEHSRLHDENVWQQLRALGWAPGKGPIFGAGKNWRSTRAGIMAPPDKSALVGWDKDGGGPGVALWQPDAIAHNRFHFDDGTLSIIFRRRARSGRVGTAVAGALSAIGAGARELASAITQRGGASVPPPLPSNQGGHELPPKKDTNVRSTIQRGSKGTLVSIWQATIGVAVDGDFGSGTETATKQWQAARGLVADGIVGPKSWARADEDAARPTTPSAKPVVDALVPTILGLQDIKLVRAKNFRTANRPASAVLWIVLHSMESAEKPYTAENVAAWFAGAAAPMASAHFCIDSDSIVQCVPLKDVAFAAPGANAEGVHIEMAGYARQTEAEWLDDFGLAMLSRVALVMASLSELYNIPLEYVDVDGLKARQRGVTTHWDVSKAFKKSDHQDPGKGFPMARVLSMAMAARATL
jgi:peptidoglycan hydrolase-like protein with peptidoglycan-binding domain